MTNEAVNVELAIREEPTAVMLTSRQLQMIASTDFVPKGLRGNVPAVLACVARGRAMGIPDMVALNGIVIIEGKATLTAELMEAIVRKHGHSITGKTTATESVLRGKRRDNGDEMEVTFNLEMAERAGLLNKMNWKKHPDDMMFARAVSKLCRRLFADCFAGGTYVPDELEATADEIIDEPRPVNLHVPDTDIELGLQEIDNDPPDDTPAVPPATPKPATTGAATPAGEAGGPNQQAEDATAHHTASPAAGIASLLPPEIQAQIAGDHIIPSGKYKGKRIADVTDERWFREMLKAKDSPTRRAAEAYHSLATQALAELSSTS